jgi:hypothetical protein
MTFNPTTKLSVAEIAIYILLLPPTLYLFYLHGRRAIMTFLYLIAFQVIRMAAAGIQISERNDARPSTAAAIVSSIGLSPLLLAFAGFVNVLREYYSTSSQRNRLFSLVNGIGVHFGAVAGIALVAAGATKLVKVSSTAHDIHTGHTMVEAGTVIFFLTWLAAVLLAAYVLVSGSQTQTPLTVRMFMLGGATFIGVRTIYSVVSGFDHSPSLSPITGTFAVKFAVAFLMLLLAALCLISVAFLTRHAGKEKSRYVTSGGMEGHGSLPLSASVKK